MNTETVSTEEVKTAIDDWYSAFDSPAIDRLVESNFGFENGYGFRAINPPIQLSESDRRTLWNTFFDSMEYYNIAIEDIEIETIGNVGVAWGYHSEKFRMKSGEEESLRVRFSFTVLKSDTGQTKIVLGHRDVQEFNAEGRYVRQIK
ncbi:MAG: hypothetical protein GKR91_04985 [Pseudomonadales bacterium]|nr:hypothetical protein [Pseudomonadales bacterium]